MQTNQISSDAGGKTNTRTNTRTPTRTHTRSARRGTILGVSIALLGAAALVLSTAGTSQVPANLVAASIEGNIIIAFDAPAHAAGNTHYRIDCSAVDGSKVSAWGAAAASPVVVGGLAAGEEYECRARINSVASTSKAVHVRVMGAD